MNKNQENSMTYANRHPVIFGDLAKFRHEKLAHVQTARILSFGCSSGEECAALIGDISDSQVYGCDINMEALGRASDLCGDRATFFESKAGDILSHGPFHVITAMNVLCRHPIGKSIFSELYPFAVFESTIELLDKALAPGGVMAIYNPQYPVEACGVINKYTPLSSRVVNNNGWLDKYTPGGQRALFNGKLNYAGTWLRHSDWLHAVRPLNDRLSDPSALEAIFEPGRIRYDFDTRTVFWVKPAIQS